MHLICTAGDGTPGRRATFVERTSTFAIWRKRWTVAGTNPSCQVSLVDPKISAHDLRPRLRTARDALRTASSTTVEAERLAAVAVVLCEHPHADDDEAPHVLLIQRAEHPRDPWSGHLAFPGGRHDVGDASLLATAVRETSEEIGLILNTESELVGALPPLHARGPQKGLVIAPYVFEVKHRTEFVLDTTEVAAAFWVPVGSLTGGTAQTRVEVQHQGAKYYLPGYQIGPKVLWGMTYEMFQTLAKVSQWLR